MGTGVIVLIIFGIIILLGCWVFSLISIIVGYKETNPKNKYLIPLGIVGICLFPMAGLIGLIYFYRNDCNPDGETSNPQITKSIYLNAKYETLLTKYQELQNEYEKTQIELNELKTTINVYFKNKPKEKKLSWKEDK